MGEGLWLGIETSGRGGGVALVRNGAVLAETVMPVAADTTERLLPAVRDIMGACSADTDDLDGIGVSLGPGSYTGLRIGVATAMGLSRGWEVPLAGVSTLKALAFGTGIAGDLLVAVRARRKEVFATAFRLVAGEEPAELFRPAAYTAEAVSRWLDGRGGIAAVGSGRQQLASADAAWLPRIFDLPRPSVVAHLARLGETDAPGKGLEPLYLRGFKGLALEEVEPVDRA